jgi:hypothetical protein
MNLRQKRHREKKAREPKALRRGLWLVLLASVIIASNDNGWAWGSDVAARGLA